MEPLYNILILYSLTLQAQKKIRQAARASAEPDAEEQEEDPDRKYKEEAYAEDGEVKKGKSRGKGKKGTGKGKAKGREKGKAKGRGKGTTEVAPKTPPTAPPFVVSPVKTDAEDKKDTEEKGSVQTGEEPPKKRKGQKTDCREPKRVKKTPAAGASAPSAPDQIRPSPLKGRSPAKVRELIAASQKRKVSPVKPKEPKPTLTKAQDSCVAFACVTKQYF